MSKKKSNTVGYGNPPKDKQYKPGQSGNPKGRPKGTKNIATDVREELDEKINITEDGKTREVSKQRAMVKTQMAKALKGDSRAASVIIQLAIAAEISDAEKTITHWDDEDDLAILKEYALRLVDNTKENPASEHTPEEEKDDENTQP